MGGETDKLTFNFDATGIGSVPFIDSKKACQVILDNFLRIPFWPQLPRRSFFESMYVQFSECLPGLVLDEKNKKFHIDTSRVAADIENVYAKYVDGDLEFFKISKDYAAGLYEFLDCFKSNGKDIKFIKGHITGPVSYGLSLTDEHKKSVIYDKDLFEILTKVLTMKARWQIKKLKAVFPKVIIFIDEPYLVSIGSSYVNINKEEVAKRLDELVECIKAEGALAGLHCCGNTDWGFLLKRGIDILSFDAYNFMKEFSLYSRDIEAFLKKGGAIAWGIVPSSDAIDKETEKTLRSRLKDDMKLLSEKGIDKKAISSLVTPSCGVGTLDENRAEKILALTSTLGSK
ncbi:MAG: methionine synthase [Candidatus Omnitrophica bacterium]|nr:methionine synthase [Candidatus Omnitrophota bacterium]